MGKGRRRLEMGGTWWEGLKEFGGVCVLSEHIIYIYEILKE